MIGRKHQRITLPVEPGSNVLTIIGGTPSGAIAQVSGYFTLSGSTNVAVQYRTSSSNGTNGLGYPCNFSEAEIYTVLEIWKIA
jgi:hypothetical protein